MQYNNVEVILPSKYSHDEEDELKLLLWLAVTVKATIENMQEHSKKLLLPILTDLPAIYLS